MPRPKTIQIYLPDGEPRGIRVAEITTRTVQLWAIPRSRLSSVANYPELGGVGVYFLVGEEDEAAKSLLYVGEAESCAARLRQQNAQKDFWKIALVLLSRTASFTKAHAKYLEWKAVQDATTAGRYNVQNAAQPAEPHITKPMKADLADAFEGASILLGTLGYPLFESISTRETRLAFSYGPTGGSATGELTEDGFVVFRGSMAAIEEKPSTDKWISNLRQELLAAGVLKLRDGSLVFEQDYLFNSPSAAAAVVRAHNVNGWNAWKDQEGRTLHEVFRAQ